MEKLLQKIYECKICQEHLPLGPRPIVEASIKSKIIIISQAPGRVVHQSGIAWMDQSGKKLRDWLGVDKATFYNTDNFAILPMGFCYPGKAKTGDMPPRKECAPQWHEPVFNRLENRQLILLIGTYASSYYLPNETRNLTAKVVSYKDYLPMYWVLPHPSPVNRFWRVKNPWFEEDVIPELQKKVKELLS